MSSRRLLNTRDALLNAARSSPLVARPLLKSLGLAIPELNRGPIDGFFSKASLNVPARFADVTIVGSASPTVHAVSELLRQGGPTIAVKEGEGREAGASKQPPKFLVVCEDWHDSEKLSRSVLSQLRQVAASARNAKVLLLAVTSTAEPRDEAERVRRACSVPAFEGFVRSLAKELGSNGSAVNGLVVSSSWPLAGAAKHHDFQQQLLQPLSFFLSPDAAFVSSQTLHLSPTMSTATAAATNSTRPLFAQPSSAAHLPTNGRFLDNRVAVVTGAARGIGQAIAMRLFREGCSVVAVDVPQAKDQLEKTCEKVAAQAGEKGVDGSSRRVAALALDITAKQAPQALHDFLLAPKWSHGSAGGSSSTASSPSPLSILVHNAGITRDKTLKNMSADQWSSVLEVNYESILRLNEKLIFSSSSSSSPPPSDSSSSSEGLGVLCPHHGRVILLSSINGLAGARGQTNYSWTKGALSGYARVLSEQLRQRRLAITAGAAGEDIADLPSAFAVAPGFIETEMTTKIPFVMRQLGRRSNALMQGGLPEDVAATIAALCLPGFASASGQTLRVCGGNMVGR